MENFNEKTEIIIELSPSSLLEQDIKPEQLVDLFVNNGYNTYAIENKYQVSEYMRQRPAYNIYPLSSEIIDQVDLLFTKKSDHY